MNQRLIFRKAAQDDLEVLIETRIKVLRVANKLSDNIDMSEVEKESRFYYEHSFIDDSHVAYLVYDGEMIVGCGGVSFYLVMPTYNNPSGKKAYVMNMYTSVEYRRKGIAYQILDLLVKEAKERGITQILLEATEMGEPLYKKYGFTKMRDEMELL